MYKVYILKSDKTKKHYTVHTKNTDDRLSRHNRGSVKSTKHGRPWKIVYTETCRSKLDAIRRELEIKRYKSGFKFRKLVESRQGRGG